MTWKVRSYLWFEWRTFAENLGAERQSADRGEARVKESRETYVLSRRSDERTLRSATA